GVLVLGRLPRHDHRHLAALVVPEPELADRPLDLTGLSGRSGLAGQARVKPLRFQELEDARDQALNVELLAVEHDRLAPGGGAQEELPPAGRADGPDADGLQGVEIEAPGHSLALQSLKVPWRGGEARHAF